MPAATTPPGPGTCPACGEATSADCTSGGHGGVGYLERMTSPRRLTADDERAITDLLARTEPDTGR